MTDPSPSRQPLRLGPNVPERRTGRTTRQLLAAPRGALYVWRCASLRYPRALARWLGRGDLVVVEPGFLERPDLRDVACAVVVDHGAQLTAEQARGLAEHEAQMRTRAT